MAVTGIEIGKLVCEALGLDPSGVAKIVVTIDPEEIVTAAVTMHPSQGHMHNFADVVRRHPVKVQVGCDAAGVEINGVVSLHIPSGRVCRVALDRNGLPITTDEHPAIVNDKGNFVYIWETRPAPLRVEHLPVADAPEWATDKPIIVVVK